MSNIFSPSEVIQLGIQIEKNGRDLKMGGIFTLEWQS